MEIIMLKIKGNTLILTISILASTAFGANASATGLTGTSSDFGANVTAVSAARHIIVTRQTKSINVTNGETVQFDIDGKAFTWHFDTFHDETNFPLSKILPSGSLVNDAHVYVASNPLYRG